VPDVARGGARAPVAQSGNASTSQASGQTSSQQADQSSSGVGPCDFCYVQDLTLGDKVSYTIGGVPDYINFHSYSVNVPEGTREFTVLLDSEGDLDLAVKYGTPIESWGDEGDWDYRDITEAPGGAFTITQPTPGVWHIDVIQYYEDRSTKYTLSVR
jgi:hypothetical protein